MTPTYFYGFSNAILKVVLHEPHRSSVPEALVQDIWLNQRLRGGGFVAVDGTTVDVLDPGRLNEDAGPDFIGARLRLGSTLWNGSVEIHVTSGTWITHRHDRDPRYDSTILHAALYHDIWTGRLRRSDGSLLPELILFPYLEEPLRRLIHSFYVRTNERILCAGGWRRVPDEIRDQYVRSLAGERMEQKSRRFGRRDRNQAIYEAVFAGLGYSKNAVAMRTLARIVPLASCLSIQDGGDLEALLLGASGLLPRPADLLDTDRETADYVMELRDRFERLNFRLEITPMPVTTWRFFRLRPANFPPLRIAQGAALLRPGGLLRADPLTRLAAAASSAKPITALRSLFATELSPFWNEHVRLIKKTTFRRSGIGKQRIDALIVNVAVPALLAHAAESDGDAGPIVRLLDHLPAPNDEITRLFGQLGTHPSTALYVQGLHQLFRTRCTEARCLSCRIGEELLRRPDALQHPDAEGS